jgi:hypothetical protein
VRLAGRVKDEQIAALTAALDASLGRERRLELRLAEAERRAAGPGVGEGFGPADRNPSSAVKTHKNQLPGNAAVTPGKQGGQLQQTEPPSRRPSSTDSKRNL